MLFTTNWARLVYSYIAYQVIKEKKFHTEQIRKRVLSFFFEVWSSWIGQNRFSRSRMCSILEREKARHSVQMIWYLIHWLSRRWEGSHPLPPLLLAVHRWWRHKGRVVWNSSRVVQLGQRQDTRRRSRGNSHPRHDYSTCRRSRGADDVITY